MKLAKVLEVRPIGESERGTVRCDMPARGTDAFECCPDPAVMRETSEGGMVHHYCAECWDALQKEVDG